MLPRTVAWAGRLALATFEVMLVQQYVARGTAWHGLIHSLTGFGAGLVVAAILSAVTARPARGLGWAAVGQLVSVSPDVLYIARDLPHRTWMDAFVGHISVHTAWAPVALTFGFFVVAGWGWWLASAAGRRTPGAVLALAAAAVYTVALLNAAPIPTRLIDFPTSGADPSTAYASGLVCRR